MNQNEGMAGGHCEGFSITALRMFDGSLEEQDFGAETTAELGIVGNEPLQGAIAQHFVYQFLPSIVDARVTGPPSKIARRADRRARERRGALHARHLHAGLHRRPCDHPVRR